MRDRAFVIRREIALGLHGSGSIDYLTPTYAEASHEFVELYAKTRNRDWRGHARLPRKFAVFDKRKITEIRRQDVARVLDEIVASGTPIRANRALAAIKKFFSWCVDRAYVDHHPIAGLKAPAKEQSRDRLLTDSEIAAIWRAADDEGFPFGPFVQLMILMAQRRGEVAGMRWSEIDEGVWTIPRERAKNSNSNVVPLPDAAIDILRTIPRFIGSDLVFTTNGETPISGFGRLNARLDAISGVGDWCLHDLRRTAATGMAKIGVEPHVIEAILNHKTGVVSGVAAIYNRHGYAEEKKKALQKWFDHIRTITICSPTLKSKATKSPSATRDF